MNRKPNKFQAALCKTYGGGDYAHLAEDEAWHGEAQARQVYGLYDAMLKDVLAELERAKSINAELVGALGGLLELVAAIQNNNPALFIPSLKHNERVQRAEAALSRAESGT